MPSPAPPVTVAGFSTAAAALVAIVLPSILAFNVPPSATFLNQAAALIGWGAWLSWLALPMAPARAATPRASGLAALIASLALLALAALASPLWAGLPWSLSLSSVALIAAAALAVWMGAALQASGAGTAAFRTFCIALAVAGVASSAVGVVQVFAPGLADGEWIARSVTEGRAVGNLRQPNHLSSLLLWSIVASVWLGEAKVIDRVGSGAMALLALFVVVLSASRTGAVGALMLALWGGADRRLSRSARTLLMLMPVAYAAFWLGTAAWAEHSHHAFLGETRFSGGGDISSSRFGIWSNTLALIAAHPWLGVGFGEFNFAWTLTPFPGRPVAFFDHTHNLPLQFAVELGVPLALLVVALMLWALWCAFRRAWRVARGAGPADAPLAPAAFVMVLMVTVHSLLEYPLWYAYFLLPAGFAFGLALTDRTTSGVPSVEPEGATNRVTNRAANRLPADEPAGARARSTSGTAPGRRGLLAACLLLMLGGGFSLYDYSRVVVIFAPPQGAPPLLQRIEDGRRSLFFAHHADYAAATTAAHPSTALSAFRTAPHFLLDARLMQAWATALAEAGDADRARHVAQRLKEFRNPQSDEFFAACSQPRLPGAVLPFQCLAPATRLGYEDFR